MICTSNHTLGIVWQVGDGYIFLVEIQKCEVAVTVCNCAVRREFLPQFLTLFFSLSENPIGVNSVQLPEQRQIQDFLRMVWNWQGRLAGNENLHGK